MTSPSASTAVGKSIGASIKAHGAGELDSALRDAFAALDTTAKLRRPTLGAGQRIKLFLTDEQVVISLFALNQIMVEVSVDGRTIPDVLYDLRNAVVHASESDSIVEFTDGGFALSAKGRRWRLPKATLFALWIAVIVAPENSNQTMTTSGTLQLNGDVFFLSDWWGRRASLHKYILEKFDHRVVQKPDPTVSPKQSKQARNARKKQQQKTRSGPN